MKVMMLSWEYPPNQVGGLAKHVYHLSHSLSQEGTQVAVVTLGGHGTAPRESRENLEIVRTVPYFSNAPDFTGWVMHANFGLLEAGLGLTREWGEPDLIHAHDWLVVYAAKALKNLLRIPLAATIHATEHGRNNGIHNPTQKYISDMEWWLTYESWRVVCCSHYMREELQRVFSLPGDKIRVIPNGVNLPAEGLTGGSIRKITRVALGGAAGETSARTLGGAPGETSARTIGGAPGETSARTLGGAPGETSARTLGAAAGRDFFARPKERIVFHVGRQVPEKGGAILLEAFAHVLRAIPEAKLVMAGTGPWGEELKRRARSLGIDHKVLFAGYLQDETVQNLYRWADVCVFPSTYEPFGIVALEAMASGAPVVVSDVGGLSEIVEHEVDGLKTYAGSSSSVADQMLRILREPELASRLSGAARDKVASQFAWDQIAQNTNAFYRQILSESARTPWVQEKDPPDRRVVEPPGRYTPVH